MILKCQRSDLKLLIVVKRPPNLVWWHTVLNASSVTNTMEQAYSYLGLTTWFKVLRIGVIGDGMTAIKKTPFVDFSSLRIS